MARKHNPAGRHTLVRPKGRMDPAGDRVNHNLRSTNHSPHLTSTSIVPIPTLAFPVMSTGALVLPFEPTEVFSPILLLTTLSTLGPPAVPGSRSVPLLTAFP